jgi:hypothetical protein
MNFHPKGGYPADMRLPRVRVAPKPAPATVVEPPPADRLIYDLFEEVRLLRAEVAQLRLHVVLPGGDAAPLSATALPTTLEELLAVFATARGVPSSAIKRNSRGGRHDLAKLRRAFIAHAADHGFGAKEIAGFLGLSLRFTYAASVRAKAEQRANGAAA